MFGELIPCGGGDPVPLMKSKLTVGRKSFCDITLPFPNVSSQHCELQLRDGFWHVRDLGSTNGIRVDGQPCDSDWLLPSDELSVASHRYSIRYSPPPDRPPPKQQKAGPDFGGSLAARVGITDGKSGAVPNRMKMSNDAGFGELIPVGGGEPIALGKPNLVIGRHGSCDIAMPHSTISARHCELEFSNGYWRVRDLGSRNGTSVEGKRYDSKWLMPGDVLGVASYRYKVMYAPQSDAPPPEEEKADFSRGLLDKIGLQRKKKSRTSETNKETAVPTVLVVDDSEVDRRLTGGHIQKTLGAEVVYAANGKDALEQILRHRPDVVITDLQMPEVDGLQLTAAIKSEYPLIPVILTTSKGNEEVAAEALRIGATSYVPKRRLAEDLASTVEHVLVAARKDRTHSQLMHHLSENESVFSFHNDLALIQAVVAHMQELLRCLPLGDETERLRVGIALEEALTNAYYHGNLEVGRSIDKIDRQAYAELAAKRRLESPYRERKITLRARITRDEAVFTVQDEGPGFDASQLPDVADEATHESIGKGIPLMRTIMDDVHYNDKGNEVTLIKRKIEPAIEATEDDEGDQTETIGT